MTTAVFVTYKGDEIICARMKGAPSSGTEPLNLGWGTGGVAGGPFAATKSDVAPFSESAESRVAGTSTINNTTTTTNDTYQVVGTITSLSNQTIAEVFLSDSASKPAGYSTSTGITVASGGVVSSTSATTLNTNATFTPGTNGYCQIRTEVMQVTGGSGTSILTVTRGQNGSTGSAGVGIVSIAAGDAVTAGNAPGSTVVTNGNLFLHASFSGLPLSGGGGSGDSLQSTVKVSFN